MKDDYDVMGPEATIQTTINNGTGKSHLHSNIMCVPCHGFLNLVKHRPNYGLQKVRLHRSGFVSSLNLPYLRLY